MHTAFVGLPEAHIELQFVERALIASTGELTLRTWSDLLMETHDAVVTHPFCGQDRWMDNHFAYATWALPGLIDDIHSKLAGHHSKYHGDRIDIAHVSTFTAAQLEGVEMDGNYSMTLWIVEPGGQSAQVRGIINT